MSLSPEPPERLAEILLEILAMSKPTWTNQSESVRDDDRTESFDADYVKEQAQRRDEEDTNRQRRSAGPCERVRPQSSKPE
jgi:hypothetical protein